MFQHCIHCHKQQPILASRTYASLPVCRRPDTVLVHARMKKIGTQWLVSFVSTHSHVIDLVRLVPCVLDLVRCLFSQHRLPARLIWHASILRLPLLLVPFRKLFPELDLSLEVTSVGPSNLSGHVRNGPWTTWLVVIFAKSQLSEAYRNSVR